MGQTLSRKVQSGLFLRPDSFWWKSYSQTEWALLHLILKEKGGDVNMANMLQDQPYKNREHVKAEIKRCAMASSVSSLLSFLFVLIGIISDALNRPLA